MGPVQLQVINKHILSSQGLSTRGGSDPGKPAWSEHFLKLAALIINELSLFG